MTTYKIVIRGVAPGVQPSFAANQLALLFKTTPEKAAALLASGSQVIKSGVDAATAAKYEATLNARGCVCEAVLESPEPEGLNAIGLPATVSSPAATGSNPTPADSALTAVVANRRLPFKSWVAVVGLAAVIATGFIAMKFVAPRQRDDFARSSRSDAQPEANIKTPILDTWNCGFQGVRDNRTQCAPWEVKEDGFLTLDVAVEGGRLDFIGFYTESQYDALYATIWNEGVYVSKREKGIPEAYAEHVSQIRKTFPVKKGKYWFIGERTHLISDVENPAEFHVDAYLTRDLKSIPPLPKQLVASPQPQQIQQPAPRTPPTAYEYANQLAAQLSTGNPACEAFANNIRLMGSSGAPDYVKLKQIDAIFEKVPDFCLH